MKHSRLLFSMTLAYSIACAGIVEEPGSEVEPAVFDEPASGSIDGLMFSLERSDLIALSGGTYRAENLEVELITGPVTADLDHDSPLETVAIVRFSGDTHKAARFLGDRVEIKNLSVGIGWSQWTALAMSPGWRLFLGPGTSHGDGVQLRRSVRASAADLLAHRERRRVTDEGGGEELHASDTPALRWLVPARTELVGFIEATPGLLKAAIFVGDQRGIVAGKPDPVGGLVGREDLVGQLGFRLARQGQPPEPPPAEACIVGQQRVGDLAEQVGGAGLLDRGLQAGREIDPVAEDGVAQPV